ncbi:MAG: S8 family serine peptidase [Phycisphaeraceae bacterium]
MMLRRFTGRTTLATWGLPPWLLAALLMAVAGTPTANAEQAEPPGQVEQAESGPERDELAGVRQAERRLGAAVPIGEGIVLGHVEGNPDAYLPRIDHRRYRGMNLRPRSGESKVLSHADSTARIIFGSAGLAPGVREVHHFATPHWITDGYLRAGQARGPAADEPDVLNHSWIGQDGRGAGQRRTAHVLRRVDDAVDRHGRIMVVGVNNARHSRVPSLLSSAYNVIAVGVASGASSGGFTQIEGEDRCKPDITGPGNRTSFTTAVVTAVTARLLEAARRLDEHASQAARPETIKALLLAGATKPWNWRQRDGRPFDEHLGAGVVHLDNALRILEAGRAQPDTVHQRSGWDLRVVEPGKTHIYRLDADEPVEELSIVLNWHRRIDGRTAVHPQTGQQVWLDTPRLARFDLRVVHISPEGTWQLIGESRSDVDNVQHVHVRDAPAGEYHVVMTRRDDDGHAEPWAVAIAWRAGEHVAYPGD